MSVKIMLKEQSGRNAITFPVTPPSFTASVGQVVQTVHIHEIGDVTLAGQRSLGSIKLSVLLPKKSYSFAAADRAPYDYIAQLTRWVEGKTVLRYIVSGTPINTEVLLEGVDYGEQDGTGDVYADITLRETVEPEAPKTVRVRGNSRPRADYVSSVTVYAHRVVKGDTMSSICLDRYGNGGKKYYEALAKHNNRSAYDDIYPGNTIYCPPLAELGV